MDGHHLQSITGDEPSLTSGVPRRLVSDRSVSAPMDEKLGPACSVDAFVSDNLPEYATMDPIRAMQALQTCVSWVVAHADKSQCLSRLQISARLVAWDGNVSVKLSSWANWVSQQDEDFTQKQAASQAQSQATEAQSIAPDLSPSRRGSKGTLGSNLILPPTVQGRKHHA